MDKHIEDAASLYAKKSIEICRGLVRCPSEDPSGDTRQAAAYISDFFTSNGIANRIISPHPEKPSVVAEICGNAPGHHLVFNGHIDTFPVGDKSKWSFDPFGAEVSEGRIYGRGAADMKGGVAAMMTAALVLKEMGKFPGRVSFTCVSDEEVNGPWGTNYLLKKFPDLYGDALINAEPSSIEHIRIGEKGIYQVRIKCSTAGGHGAYVGLKSNAIEQMTSLLASLADFASELPNASPEAAAIMNKARESYDKILCAGATDKALVPTMNIGTISGGIMVNLVPEQCVCEIDFRLPPGIGCREVAAWLHDKAGAEATIEIIKGKEAYLTSPEHALTKCVKRAAEEICGAERFVNYSLGGTEAVLWRAHGIPAVQYGPNHHNMGSPDEYVMVQELPIVAQVHAISAWRYLNDIE